MKHDFLDKYAGLNSFIHRLDPRTKIIAALSMLIVVISETPAGINHFYIYYFFILAFVVFSKVPVSFIIKRTLLILPFILITAASIPLSAWLSRSHFDAYSFTLALLVILKAVFAVITLTLLTSVEKFHVLLAGFRKLKMPSIFGIISALMYRYIFILIDELHRTRFARESRAPGDYKINRFKIYGNQAAVIFLRSWERADKVYQSMLARGFNGSFPEMKNLNYCKTGSIFVVIILIIFITTRLL
jgi:cobalt/nickel transport system permease protein